MIPLNIEIIGLDRVNKGLNHVQKGIDVLKPLWKLFGDEFYAEETRLFSEAPWTPLSDSYAEQKAKEFGDKPLLRATDVLFKSLTQEGAEANIHRTEDQFAEFGSSDPKAVFHRSGAGNLPIRDPLAKPQEDRYLTIAGEYVERLVQEATQ